MALYDIPIHTLQGDDTSLGDYKGKTLLLVNVASKCGLTPQYEGLERLQKTYGDRGLLGHRLPVQPVHGPGARHLRGDRAVLLGHLRRDLPAHGEDRRERRRPHPIYAELTEKEDAEGNAGDITWNFEKFLVSPEGDVVARYRPQVEPEDPTIVADIEAQLTA